jgi:hypothetical protein
MMTAKKINDAIRAAYKLGEYVLFKRNNPDVHDAGFVRIIKAKQIERQLFVREDASGMYVPVERKSRFKYSTGAVIQ